MNQGGYNGVQNLIEALARIFRQEVWFRFAQSSRVSIGQSDSLVDEVKETHRSKSTQAPDALQFHY